MSTAVTDIPASRPAAAPKLRLLDGDGQPQKRTPKVVRHPIQQFQKSEVLDLMAELGGLLGIDLGEDFHRLRRDRRAPALGGGQQTELRPNLRLIVGGLDTMATGLSDGPRIRNLRWVGLEGLA